MDNLIPIQEQLLETLRSAQDKVVAAVRDWTVAIEGFVPDLPFVDQLPKASETVDQAIDFAAKVLERQREFVTSLLDTVGDVFDTGDTGDTGDRDAPVAANAAG